MWHPNPEDLARLVDEPPTDAEAAHLATCADCTAQLDAMRAEHDALGSLPRILPVPTSWESMRQRLDREGLLSGGTRGRFAWMPGIAAAIALFVAGGVTGIALADGTGSRAVAVGSELVSGSGREPSMQDLETIPVHEDSALREAEEAPAKLAAQAMSPSSQYSVREIDDEGRLPSLYGAPASSPNWDAIALRASRARTPDEAAGFVRDAEGAYLAAMTRLAELTTTQSADPSVRLATLDGIVLTTGAALERAPADPVINGYHLAARAQRDALLRTVSSSPEQDPWY